MISIKEQWESYRRHVIPRNATEVQVRECMRAFYAGAQSMMNINIAVSDESITEEVGEQILANAHDELQNFVSSVMSGVN